MASPQRRELNPDRCPYFRAAREDRRLGFVANNLARCSKIRLMIRSANASNPWCEGCPIDRPRISPRGRRFTPAATS